MSGRVELFDGMPFRLPFSLFCASDVHLEFDGLGPSHEAKACCVAVQLVKCMPTAEVCVLAGDIGDPTEPRFSVFLKACAAKYTLVLFVPGNHEFWTMADAPMRTLVESCGVTYLNNNAVTYRGVRFLGTTMWTLLPTDRETDILTATWGINDFKHIDGLDVETWRARHNRARDFLVEELTDAPSSNDSSGSDGEVDGESTCTIVVTHHAPSSKCLAPAYIGDPLNMFYASNLESWMTSSDAPAVWICGHTHHPCCETIGCTLVVNNPRRNARDYGLRPSWTAVQDWWHSE